MLMGIEIINIKIITDIQWDKIYHTGYYFLFIGLHFWFF